MHGLDFAFGYLNDILVFSLDIEAHLKHLEIIFKRLKEADLKLKESKCNFLKAHLQYFGHLVSGKGITSFLEKLESIQNMPPPRNPKEVGYYYKFIPQFADIVRPMTTLTKKDECKSTAQCHEASNLLKKSITTEPILKYPDPHRPYTLFTNARKYAWACVLTQAYDHEQDGKNKTILHPSTYMSGLFRGSQLNWAALTKEVYAIYIYVKKLTYYVEDSEITLHSDHLP